MEEQVILRAEQGGKMQEKETLDEKLPGLFEPDTLLPIQYFEAMRKKHLLEGEKRLILSVLEDAIECYMKCIDAATHKGQRLFRDAEEWINHEDKRWVFSFDNVCDMLDINPEYMRRGLHDWKQRHVEMMEGRRAAMEAQAIAAAQPVPAALPDEIVPVAASTVAPKAASGSAKARKAAVKTAGSHRKVERARAVRRPSKFRKAHRA